MQFSAPYLSAPQLSHSLEKTTEEEEASEELVEFFALPPFFSVHGD